MTATRDTLYIWKINTVDERKGIDDSECRQESEIYLSNDATGFLVILFERRRCLPRCIVWLIDNILNVDAAIFTAIALLIERDLSSLAFRFDGA